MTTSETRSSDPDGELPISPDDLARLAGQIYSELSPHQAQQPVPTAPAALDSAPGSAPVAPRGSVPDTTSAGAPAHAVGSAAGTSSPLGVDVPRALPDVPGAETRPGGNDSLPGSAPVAPRGGAPTPPAASALPSGFDIPSGTLAPIARYTDRPSIASAPTPPATLPGRGDLPASPDVFGWLPSGDAIVGAPPAAPTRRTSHDHLFVLGDHRRSGAIPAGALGTPSEGFDVHTVRADFPILSETVNGHPLIWFDNAATTQKPQQVIDRIAHFYAHENSNIHRAAHELAARATDAYEDARETVRSFLGASRVEEIVFVRGTTEAINLVAQSWGRRNLGPGDEIVITHLEHHANIVPWQIVAQQTGAVIKVAPVDDRGNLLLDELTHLVGPRTKLVSATQVANATGTVTPVVEIARIARRVGARVLIDGAQSVPHLAVDLQELDADFFVFSGHKILGPTGIGAVFIRERVWDETPAWQGGGNMIADVTHERSIYQGPPNKYEAGTGNIADAVGLAEALRYVRRIGLSTIEAYEHRLLEHATGPLAAIPGVELVGTADHKASVLSFVLAGRDPLEVGTALNERGIAVRAGHHCAQPILRRLGHETTVRPSFAFYNTVEEIDVFLDAVRDIAAERRS